LNLQDLTTQIKTKYETPDLNYSDTLRWKNLLEFSSESDVITPAILSQKTFGYAYPYFEKLKKLSEEIVLARNKFCEEYKSEAINEIDGKAFFTKLTEQFAGRFSRVFNNEYKSLILCIQSYSISNLKIKYQDAVDFADSLMKLQEMNASYAGVESAAKGWLGPCYQGVDTDWKHVLDSMEVLKDFIDEPEGFGALNEMSSGEFAENQLRFKEDSNRISKEIEPIEDAKNRIA